MPSITLLPQSILEKSTGFINSGNLTTENGIAYANLSNGDKEWVNLNYYLPSEILNNNHFFYWNLTDEPTLNFDCKSSRSNTTLYHTRPYISQFYYAYTGQPLTTHNINWNGSQTDGQNWKSYSYTDPTALPNISSNLNACIDNYGIGVVVGVNKYYGALRDDVSLRNCKLNISYQLIGCVDYSYGNGFELSSDILQQRFAEGNSVVISTPSNRNGYVFDGWYTALNGGTKMFDGGETHTFTEGYNKLYAHWRPLSSIYVGTQKVKEIYIGTSKVKEAYLGTTKVYG